MVFLQSYYYRLSSSTSSLWRKVYKCFRWNNIRWDCWEGSSQCHLIRCALGRLYHQAIDVNIAHKEILIAEICGENCMCHNAQLGLLMDEEHGQRCSFFRQFTEMIHWSGCYF